MTEKTTSGVHVSPGTAETLVRRGEITYHQSIAYSLNNISAKNYQNRLICVEVIVCYISVVFLRHSVEKTRSLTSLTDLRPPGPGDDADEWTDLQPGAVDIRANDSSELSASDW